MVRKSEYARQFKDGTYPDQHWDESTRVNGHEVDPPSTVWYKRMTPEKMRKRNGLALGFEAQAYPGMIGKNDYDRLGGR